MRIYLDAKFNKELEINPISGFAFELPNGDERFVDAEDIDWNWDNGILAMRFKGVFYLDNLEYCGDELLDLQLNHLILYDEVDEDFELTDIKVELNQGDDCVEKVPLYPPIAV